MNKRKMNDTQVERGGTAYGRAMIAVGITAAVLALAYLAGAFFFAGHYYWRTQIDGTDYSFRSKEQVREEILILPLLMSCRFMAVRICRIL